MGLLVMFSDGFEGRLDHGGSFGPVAYIPRITNAMFDFRYHQGSGQNS
jgi:hypothetical protein